MNRNFLVKLSLFILPVFLFGVYFLLPRPVSDENIRNFCSCLYVEENPEDMCRKLYNLSPSRVLVDTTEAKVFTSDKYSKFISTRMGCDETQAGTTQK